MNNKKSNNNKVEITLHNQRGGRAGNTVAALVDGARELVLEGSFGTPLDQEIQDFAPIDVMSVGMGDYVFRLTCSRDNISCIKYEKAGYKPAQRAPLFWWSFLPVEVQEMNSEEFAEFILQKDLSSVCS